MTAPEWLKKALQKGWPGIVLKWTPYLVPRDRMIPILGPAIDRKVFNGSVYYRITNPDTPGEGRGGYVLQFSDRITDGRFVVSDQDQDGQLIKIVDCVDAEGRLINLDTSGPLLIGRIQRAYEAFDRMCDDIERIKAEKVEAAEKDSNEAAEEPMNWLAEKFGGVAKVGRGRSPSYKEAAAAPQHSEKHRQSVLYNQYGVRTIKEALDET